MAVVVGACEGVAVRVPRGLASRVVRRGWARVTAGVPRPVGGCAGRPLGPSWASSPGGCRQQVICPVPLGVTGRGCASDAPL